MGCCCAKEQVEEDIGERSRLLGSTDLNQKSRFLDANTSQSNLNGLNNPNYQRNMGSSTIDSTGSNTSLNGQLAQNNSNGNSQNGQNHNKTNEMFDKILSEVIHVSAFDQRGNNLHDDSSSLQPVDEGNFKIKGLLEPTKNYLTLPEGVPVPVTVLSAQPPFSTDISLITNFAREANNCISSFELKVPENVSYNFNPITQ